MAILKDLIVHGSSRFLNKIYASEIQTPLIKAEAGIIKKLKADDATIVGLLDVQGQLHTSSWTNSNIATIDGSFYITPTIESSQGTVGNISASTLNFSRKSGGDDFATVSSLYLGNGTSITWPRYSKILITGQILLNGEWIPLGTLLGQLNAAATAASIKVYNITDNKNRNSSILATLANSGITSTTYRNLKVSLYQRANGASSFYPLGIYMTATGINGKTFLDIYGGVELLNNNINNSDNYGGFADPNVRIGNLQGLPSVGGQTPSGWGIYTDNGYFKGIIAADKGYIGSGSRYWVIANYEDGSNPNNSRSYIYSYNGTDNGTDSVTSTVEGIYLGTDGIRNYKDNTHNVTIKDGVITALGVNLTGQINATAGNIGGASITGGVLTVPAAYISGELTAATINGSKITANSITAGQIAASAITADELAVNAVTSTKIKAGEVKADNIAANAVTAGKISVDNLSAITANLGTITTGVIKHDTVGGTNGIWLSADTDTSLNVTVGNSTARKDWRLLVNNKFGVTKTGDLYASSANISGTIIATDGTIGGINIVNGVLDVSSISIGSLNGANNYAQKTDVTQAIDNIEIGGRNLILQSSMERESPKSVNNSAYASPIPNISDYGISLLNNTTDYFTYSFDYEIIGNTAENAYVYAQIKGSSISNGDPYTTKNIINEPVGKYCATFKLTDSQINSTTKTASIRLRNATDNAILIVKNIKLEKGNKATDWTPAPEDTQENINNVSTTANTALSQSVWYAECSTAAGTAVKIATISPVVTNFVLTKGVTVNIKFTNTNSATNSSLQLNVNGTGAKNIKYIYNGTYTNIVAGYLKANQMYQFRYDGTYWIVQMMYNNYDRSQYAVSLYASEAISSARIAVLGLDGKLHILNSSSFNISCPLLYIGTTYSADDVTKPTARASNYTYWGASFNLTNTHSVQSAVANTNVYVVGTLSGDIFTPNTTVLTCAEPSTENGLYYMLLGRMTSTTNAVLQAEHPIYIYTNGKFQKYEGTTATSYITYIDANDGIKIHNAQDTLNYLQLNSTAISMFRDSGDGIYSDEVLRIDDSGIRVGKNEGPHFSLVNDKLMGYGNNNNIYFEVGKGDNVITWLFFGDGSRTSFEIGPLIKQVTQVKKENNILIEGTDYNIEVASIWCDIYFKEKPDLNSTITVTYKNLYKDFIYTVSSSSTEDVIRDTYIKIKTHKEYEAEILEIKRSGNTTWTTYNINTNTTLERENFVGIRLTSVPQAGAKIYYYEGAGTGRMLFLGTSTGQTGQNGDLFYFSSATVVNDVSPLNPTIHVLKVYSNTTTKVSYNEEYEGDYIYTINLSLDTGDQVKLSYNGEEHLDLTPDTITTNYTWDNTHNHPANSMLSIPSVLQIISVVVNEETLSKNIDYIIENDLKSCYLVFNTTPSANEKIEIEFSTRKYNSYYDSTYFNFSNMNSEDAIKGIGAASFGSDNINKGVFCLAEGVGNIVTGYASHVEGCNNIATGSHIHVGGSNSFASGQNGFAHGDGLKATYLNSAAFGYYNSPDNQIFSIGKGGSTNAFSVNKDGDIQLGGQLLAGTTYTNKRPLFAERNIIWNVASIEKNSSWTKSISVDYSGYRPIGICGFGVYNKAGVGTNADWCVFPRLYIWHSTSDTMDVYVWNQNTSAAATNVVVYVKILYMATSVVSFDWSSVTYTG